LILLILPLFPFIPPAVTFNQEKKEGKPPHLPFESVRQHPQPSSGFYIFLRGTPFDISYYVLVLFLVILVKNAGVFVF
jgi:hypothetical protein